MTSEQKQMSAVALSRFGGVEELRVRRLPIPELGPDDVLIRVQAAGVGEWDPFEREGGYTEMVGITPAFPYVLGSEGAGMVAAVGRSVRDHHVGDAVYALGFLNPKGGFYAEYAVVPAGLVAPIPRGVSVEQAAAMGGVGITALRGLDPVLGLKRGDTLAIVGASGGIGHLAIQLAKRRAARVLAIASGKDGVALAAQLGADAAVDGRGDDDLLAAAYAFAPHGLDAALVTAGGAAIDRLLQGVRKGGRIAVPNGVEPLPQAPPGVDLSTYNGDPDPDILAAFQREMIDNPLQVHVAKTFTLDRAADAHRALDEHYLGKLALRTDGPVEGPTPLQE